ncbi:conserved hypothetical protein [Lodderomyces elongisporus NRRL YB-4239]|uniref:Uncharacterized protein n=1 Tax=Lodderomyces elongisporus (strain ATCC 11503 / CBS 2605 / JCM 1781 / NBRC 1676 / NRRL YB-4239) TaxID=379508 RepID=A5DZJ1_LODEL|nr:conserved hypothetical protein [Lodderomyces elongisporus NRRL YB-4239]
MTEPTIAFHLQTHQTQFKIPTELIKKNFKNIQKLIEKQKKQLTDDILKIKKNDKMPTQIKLEMIRKLIKNFELFRKKLLVLVRKDEEYRGRMIARLENIAELVSYCKSNGDSTTNGTKNGTGGGIKNSFSDQTSSQAIGEHEENKGKVTEMELDFKNADLIMWYRDQANLLIIDYLIKLNQSLTKDQNAGIVFLESLSKTNPNLKKLIDYDVLLEFNTIFLSIVKKHDLTQIVAWFSENKSQLKKNISNLEFEINYCKFLSLIELGKIDEAIKYSRESLSGYGNQENYLTLMNDTINHTKNLEKLKGLGGLLVFKSMNDFDLKSKLSGNLNGVGYANDIETGIENQSIHHQHPYYREYKRLLSNERWESLGQCFIDNFIQLYGIPKTYPLFIYLSAGLSSLKTKSCYCNYENTIFKDASLGRENVVPVGEHSNAINENTNTMNANNGSSSSDHFIHFAFNHGNMTNIHVTSEGTGAGIISQISASTIPINNDQQVLSGLSKEPTDTKLRGPDQYYKLLGKVNNCPVCTPELFHLSKNLPFAQLITSVPPEPFRLPNGNIYPFQKLLNPNDDYNSIQNDLVRQGSIKDPLTKEVFPIDHCRRVYPV